MIELASLADLANTPPGEQVAFTALVVDVKQMVASNGKMYSRVYIRDDKDATSVPLWDVSLDSAREMYTVDEIYAFGAITDSYNGKTTIKRFISATQVTDIGIIKRMKQHMFKCAVDSNINLIYITIDKLKPTKYYKYLVAIYGETAQSPQAENILNAFASINHHDNYPGGFVNHVGGMLRIAGHIRNSYLSGRCESKWNVDWPFVMAGILLHDIGKLETYSLITRYTVRFKDNCLLDHNMIGVGRLYCIHDDLSEEDRLDELKFQQLAYTICYHDTLDKLYEHKRVEDKIISFVDGLEASLADACSLEV